MLLLNVMIIIQCCLVPYAMLLFLEADVFTVSVCLAECVNVGWLKNTTSPVKSESKMRTEDGRKKKIDIFKGFHFNSFACFHFYSVYVHHKDGTFFWLRQVTLNCLMSHI